MRFPVQAAPIFRAFMRNVVGRQWSPAERAEAFVRAADKSRRKGRSKRGEQDFPVRECLVRLTTFGGAR